MKPKLQTNTLRWLALVAGFVLLAGILPEPAQASIPGPVVDPSQQAANFEWTALRAGAYHTCGLTPAGEVICWGANHFGQFGSGSFDSNLLPPLPAILPGAATAITVGDHHSCAVVAGAGYCWGYNNSGQLGDGTLANSHTPLAVYGLPSSVIALAAGASHTCALTQSGTVYCWGEGGNGQLGNGSFTDQPGATEVPGLTGVETIVAGDNHTCAVTNAGGLLCWGKNWDGQLGNGENDSQPAPVQVAGLSSGVSDVAAGSAHTCALANNKAWCWGANNLGQLGIGSTTSSNTPIEVTGLAGVNGLAAGGLHTCASTAGGTFCWGENVSGQVGDGSLETRLAPVKVIGLSGSVSALELGSWHSCALIGASGYCWGNNAAGQLGDGQVSQRNLPSDVVSLSSDTTDISAGPNQTCAVAGGIAKCWGNNVSGELGNGATQSSSVPALVVGLPAGATTVSAGLEFSCAVADGVWCWGANYQNQLGGGTTKGKSLVPVGVLGLSSGAQRVSTGAFHACALTGAGGVKCWGQNTSGELGDGLGQYHMIPVEVVGLASGVAAITTGDSFTCALTEAGTVKCWGTNWMGQLGDGTYTGKNAPIDVPGLSDIISLDAGLFHTCALTGSGQVFCWGNNESGQLGDGTTTNRNTPVEALGLPDDLIAVSAGYEHTCAMTTGGGIFCWGNNQNGQLGDGSVEDSLTPVAVSGFSSGAGAISLGFGYSCALTQHGAAKCWGSDANGKLGVGTEFHQTSPVKVVVAPPAHLTLNHPDGRPGSFFTLTGWGFPPNSQAALSINGVEITNDVQINPTGSFIAFLDTALAPAGEYSATLSAAPGASVKFTLSSSAPLRLQQGGGLTFILPSEFPEQPKESLLFLPVLRR